MRKKLDAFLKDSGFSVKFHNCITQEHYWGKSFYNDGTYQENIYKISKGGNYWFLHDKISGRARFTLKDKDYHIILLDFSQSSFIGQLEKQFII